MKNKIRKAKEYLFMALLAYMALHFVYIYFFAGEPETQYGADLAYVHFVDVGQGDSAIIQGNGAFGGFNVLIDGGERNSGLLEYIDALGIERFDYVIATHPHSDHIGGLVEVIKQYEIDTFMAPDVTHTSKTFENMLDALEEKGLEITVPVPGDRFGNTEIYFNVLAPDLEEDTDNLNDYSIALRLDCGDVSFLFAGDAEASSERKILERGADLNADVYKVSHHGSSTSTTQEFLDAIAPQYAVISCGKDNSYGHPHRETMEKLNGIGAEIYRTDTDGNVLIVTDGTNIHVTTHYLEQ